MKKLAIAAIAVLAIPGISVVSTTARAASVPIYQLNMDAVPSINPEGVRRVQTLLKERGFDPGPIDGVVGVRTMGALRAFRETFGIKREWRGRQSDPFCVGRRRFGRTARLGRLGTAIVEKTRQGHLLIGSPTALRQLCV